MSSYAPHPPITVTHLGGVKFEANIRSHRIITDQPVSASGEDAGPTPLELLGAALGSCVALYVQQFFRARGVDHTGMRIEVEQQTVPHPSRVGQFVAHVFLPAELPDATLALVNRVAKNCPAHNTLVHGAEVVVEIHSAAAPALV